MMDWALEKMNSLGLWIRLLGLLSQDDLNKENTDSDCSTQSVTRIQNKENVCAGEEIINYRFSEGPVDSRIWTTEQYIPGKPDWQFNVYRNSPDVLNVKDGSLFIKPKLDEEFIRKDIDLNPGCTREGECKRIYVSILNPPIVSGKLQSKTAFSFGNITVRAKLPLGDYLYPEIYLESIKKESPRRIVIAYARGNKNYENAQGQDFGARVLYGGTYTTTKEKFSSMAQFQSTEPIGNSWHTFNILWTPDSIELAIDGEHYGSQSLETLRGTGFDKESMVQLVLGVGAGGPFDFPDKYTSSGQPKVYGSFERSSILQFLNNKDKWFNSWGAASPLLVEYVTVTAL